MRAILIGTNFDVYRVLPVFQEIEEVIITYMITGGGERRPPLPLKFWKKINLGLNLRLILETPVIITNQ